MSYATLGESPEASSRCAAAGGFYTVFPQGHPNAGAPACRFRAGDGSLHYADALNLAEAMRRDASRVWGWTTDQAVNAANAADDAARALLASPRDAIASALGVPPLAVTVILLYVGYVALKAVVGGAGGWMKRPPDGDGG